MLLIPVMNLMNVSKLAMSKLKITEVGVKSQNLRCKYTRLFIKY